MFDAEPLTRDVLYTHECARCGSRYRAAVGFCLSCGSTGLVYPVSWRPISADVPSRPGLSARELAKQDQRGFVSRAYPDIKLGPGALVSVWGPPGAGKSTFALLFAQGLQPAVYLPMEEKIGPTLADRLRRLEVRDEGIQFEEPQTAAEILCYGERARCVIVDSVTVTTLLPSDLLGAAKATSSVFVAVLQVTKAEAPAGSMGWLHMADVTIEVNTMRATVAKSRFGPCVSVPVM